MSSAKTTPLALQCRRSYGRAQNAPPIKDHKRHLIHMARAKHAVDTSPSAFTHAQTVCFDRLNGKIRILTHRPTEVGLWEFAHVVVLGFCVAVPCNGERSFLDFVKSAPDLCLESASPFRIQPGGAVIVDYNILENLRTLPDAVPPRGKQTGKRAKNAHNLVTTSQPPAKNVPSVATGASPAQAQTAVKTDRVPDATAPSTAPSKPVAPTDEQPVQPPKVPTTRLTSSRPLVTLGPLVSFDATSKPAPPAAAPAARQELPEDTETFLPYVRFCERALTLRDPKGHERVIMYSIRPADTVDMGTSAASRAEEACCLRLDSFGDAGRPLLPYMPTEIGVWNLGDLALLGFSVPVPEKLMDKFLLYVNDANDLCLEEASPFCIMRGGAAQVDPYSLHQLQTLPAATTPSARTEELPNDAQGLETDGRRMEEERMRIDELDIKVQKAAVAAGGRAFVFPLALSKLISGPTIRPANLPTPSPSIASSSPSPFSPFPSPTPFINTLPSVAASSAAAAAMATPRSTPPPGRSNGVGSSARPSQRNHIAQGATHSTRARPTRTLPSLRAVLSQPPPRATPMTQRPNTTHNAKKRQGSSTYRVAPPARSLKRDREEDFDEGRVGKRARK